MCLRVCRPWHRGPFLKWALSWENRRRYSEEYMRSTATTQQLKMATGQTEEEVNAHLRALFMDVRQGYGVVGPDVRPVCW